MKYVWKFLGAWFWLNFVLMPPLILGLAFLIDDTQTIVLDEFTFLCHYMVTDAAGNTYAEDYDYNLQFNEVTITISENDTILSTETRAITRQDPLLNDLREDYPPEHITPAQTKRDADGGYVILTYYDETGDCLGHSEQFFNTYDRLGVQRDYDAEGNLLRTIEQQWSSHQETKRIPKEGKS